MTSLVEALSRIDPAAGLVKYVTDTKPYHTKILDVQIEYVYTDSAVGTASDLHQMLINQFSLKPDVTYSCGYGTVWDNRDIISDYYQIIRATAPQEGNLESNSFVIPLPATAEIGFFVHNQQSATFRFANQYTINAYDSNSRTFVVTGNITSTVAVGDKVGVNTTLSNGEVRNVEYTVTARSYAGGNTTLTVSEIIPTQTQVPGTLSVFMPETQLPLWTYKPVKVMVRTTDSLPGLVSPTAEYYLVPGSVLGTFTLAYKRYPQTWVDYVHPTTSGSGKMYLTRTEIFQPMEQLQVYGSTLNRNDGVYSVLYTTHNATTVTIFVAEPIKHTTPTGAASDGAIQGVDTSGYDQTTVCDIVTAPELHAQGRLYENITFEFDIGSGGTFGSHASGFVVENPAQGGFSSTGYSGDVPYDEVVANLAATTVTSSGDLLVYPAGFDITMYDASTFDGVPVDLINGLL